MDTQTFKNNSEILTPEEYLKLTKEQKSNIEETQIIPSSLGSSSFGKIKVFYKTPIYKAFCERKK